MKLANNATSTLAAAIGTLDTTLSIQSADAAKFPSLLVGEAFPLTLVDPAGNREICRVTGRSGSALTVVRGAEGTAARAFPIGAKAELRITAAVFDDKAEWDEVEAALDLKADTSHTHAMADITGLAAALAAKADSTALASVIPAGAVFHFARASAPTGYLKANGAAISRTTYAALYAAIGTTFGAGDGSTTFNLPDLRAEFIRGLDDSRGVDSGRTLGSAQSGQNAAHTHTGSTSSDSHNHTGTTNAVGDHTHNIGSQGYSSLNGVANNAGALRVPSTNAQVGIAADLNGGHSHTFTTSSDAHAHTFTTASSGGTEARPRNVALLACIKY